MFTEFLLIKWIEEQADLQFREMALAAVQGGGSGGTISDPDPGVIETLQQQGWGVPALVKTARDGETRVDFGETLEVEPTGCGLGWMGRKGVVWVTPGFLRGCLDRWRIIETGRWRRHRFSERRAHAPSWVCAALQKSGPHCALREPRGPPYTY